MVSILQSHLFIALLAAHLVADFVLQSRTLLKQKRETLWGVPKHIVIVVATTLLLSTLKWEVILIVAVSHLVMDYIKSIFMKEDKLWQFWLDQAVHISVIIVLTVFYGDTATLWITPFLSSQDLTIYLAFLILGGGWIIIWQVCAIHIRIVLKSLEETDPGVKSSDVNAAGILIGQLERSIIYVFLLAGQPTAVGFLITAKSILRFSNKGANEEDDDAPKAEKTDERKLSEYIIIGTLLSFSTAILVSYLTRSLLQLHGITLDFGG